MQKQTIHLFHITITSFVMLVLILLFSACTSLTSSSGSSTMITGKIISVDTAHHSVTLNVNGQLYTVSGLTDQQVAVLQGQVGKTYTIQVTQNSSSSYTINSGSEPEQDETATPGVETPSPNETENTGTAVQGTIEFIGKVQSVSSNSITVDMPNGHNLSMSITVQTDRSNLNGVQLSQGQLVRVKAIANADGSFTAAKLDLVDQGELQDQSTVTYQGITTSTVGSDRVLHFKVGNQQFSYGIASTADLEDFNGNVQFIGNNRPIEVEVQFQSTTGTVIKAKASNN